jgi:hypothetical protein
MKDVEADDTDLLFFRSFKINPLTSELNPSAQLCLTRFLTRDFAS